MAWTVWRDKARKGCKHIKSMCKRRPWFAFAIVGFTFLLGSIYIFTPAIIRYHLNYNVLNQLGEYRGRVKDVDVALFDGAYVLKGIYLNKITGSSRLPFFTADNMAISLSWEALRHGEILVRADIERGVLNFLDANKESKRQTGKGTNWLQAFENVLPTTLHTLRLVDSEVTFQNFDTEPKVDVRMTNINAKISNLTNVKDELGQRVTSASLDANVLGEGVITAKADVDPFNFNDFALSFSARDIALKRLNDFAKAYGGFDFKAGRGEVFVELVADDGKLDGYVKPLFKNVDILSWSQDVEKQNDGPIQVLWESLLGTVKTVLTNINTGKVATDIHITGTVSEAEVNTWQALWGLLENAFLDAISAEYEGLTEASLSE